MRFRADITQRLQEFYEWFSCAEKAFAPDGWQEIALEAKAEIERLRGYKMTEGDYL